MFCKLSCCTQATIEDSWPNLRFRFFLNLTIDTEYLSWSDQSNATLRMADAEYKGQRSILGWTRRTITSLTRQDLIDRYYELLCVLKLFLLHMMLARSYNLLRIISAGITSSSHSLFKRTGFWFVKKCVSNVVFIGTVNEWMFFNLVPGCISGHWWSSSSSFFSPCVSTSHWGGCQLLSIMYEGPLHCRCISHHHLHLHQRSPNCLLINNLLHKFPCLEAVCTNRIFMMPSHSSTSTKVPSHNFHLQEVRRNLSCTLRLVLMTPGTTKNCDCLWHLVTLYFWGAYIYTRSSDFDTVD